MPASARPGRARVEFIERFWAEDRERATPAGQDAADTWRAEAERNGVLVSELRACDAEGPDGTRLAGCAKTYVPAPAGPWGAVMALAIDPDTGRPRLQCMAFGLRHPPAGRRQSVYQLAHQRLHGT